MSKNIKISGKILARYDEIISDEALQFIQEIHENFNKTRLQLVNERKKRQKAIDDGAKLDFLDETKKIRNTDWKIKNIPKDLLKRQVEITGPPVPKKMLLQIVKHLAIKNSVSDKDLNKAKFIPKDSLILASFFE